MGLNESGKLRREFLGKIRGRIGRDFEGNSTNKAPLLQGPPDTYRQLKLGEQIPTRESIDDARREYLKELAPVDQRNVKQFLATVESIKLNREGTEIFVLAVGSAAQPKNKRSQEPNNLNFRVITGERPFTHGFAQVQNLLIEGTKNFAQIYGTNQTIEKDTDHINDSYIPVEPAELFSRMHKPQLTIPMLRGVPLQIDFSQFNLPMQEFLSLERRLQQPGIIIS